MSADKAQQLSQVLRAVVQRAYRQPEATWGAITPLTNVSLPKRI